MSSYCRKLCFRAPLGGITKLELLEKFRQIQGEPSSFDDDDEDDYSYFYFDYCEREPPYYNPLMTNEGVQGVELVLWEACEDYGDNDFYTCPKLSIQEIKEYAQKMVENFGVSFDSIHLRDLYWYNGIDEPGLEDE